MTNEESIKVLNAHREHWERLLRDNICDKHEGAEFIEACDMAIKALEAQPTDAKQDCEHCIHTYGTLGCCDMVNNEWVYDCDFGKEQYKKEHESQPTECKFCDKYQAGYADGWAEAVRGGGMRNEQTSR